MGCIGNCLLFASFSFALFFCPCATEEEDALLKASYYTGFPEVSAASNQIKNLWRAEVPSLEEWRWNDQLYETYMYNSSDSTFAADLLQCYYTETTSYAGYSLYRSTLYAYGYCTIGYCSIPCEFVLFV